MSAASTLCPTPRLSGHRWLIIPRQPMPPPVLPLRSKVNREHASSVSARLMSRATSIHHAAEIRSIDTVEELNSVSLVKVEIHQRLQHEKVGFGPHRRCRPTSS